MAAATWGLVTATFVASFVEFVEALTIVLAMGITRGWRSALAGTAAAVLVLAAFTAVAGYALATWLPEAALQLVVGTLLLIFGLQWLRKAALRSSGLKAMHDESAAYAGQLDASRAVARRTRGGVDVFGFVVSFKGVFLEGAEIVFIVLTFGLPAHRVPVAALAAAAAGIVVVTLGALVHRPLSAVPENTLKYGVGLLLASFGTFWAIEGLGVLRGGHGSIAWPGGEWSLPVLVVAWFLVSRLLVLVLPRLARRTRASTTEAVS